MKLPVPEQGLIIRYSYLWRREHRKGRTEGQKDRPCLIMLVEPLEIGLRVMVAPITHSAPEPEDIAVQLSPQVRSGLGLDANDQWVILDEVNQFIWPGFDLRALPRDATRPDYGHLPPKLLDTLRARLIEAFDARDVRAVNRD
jgi:hypothetical protein